ncbi:nose resistant to fluoxetine protein 6 [Biomphalaria pfeifferi]|uniref:Nose resistant to fluoxetine protein 6 n=1 Tax=Biomphalaria pfeifferi TaxID=112525 RepID=A0AAD8F8C9_BIOPF|nr:nose resistant to fluoxetine protein 6 [Biomphalaria pfeifferi]
MNKLTAFFALLFLFTSFAITVADDTTGSPDPKTFLGAFENINDVIRRQNDPEFQETLKNFETLLSGKDILGQTGILGNAVFAAPSSGSIYSAINNSNDIQNGVENQVDTFGESTWSLADAVDKKDGSQNLRRKIRKVNSANCVADIQRLVTNVTQNQWTLPFLDAWGKPGPSILQGRLNFVGNYRQCRNAKAPPQPGVGGTGFTGNYCVLSFAAKLRAKVPTYASGNIPQNTQKLVERESMQRRSLRVGETLFLTFLRRHSDVLVSYIRETLQ